MSGGHFDYKQYLFYEIAEEIERAIARNNMSEHGDYGLNLDAEIIGIFQKATYAIKTAGVYATRIDWLLSGDDGEEEFKRRLAEELENLE